MEALEIKPTGNGNGNHNGHWPVEEARRRIKELVDSGQISNAEICKQAGMSVSVLSRFMRAIYEGDSDGIAGKLQKWFETRASQTGFLLPAPPDFIRTATAERILNALAYGQMACDLVVIHGEAGLGKTESIKHYMATQSAVWIVRASPATATVATILAAIRKALGIRAASRGRKAADIQEHLIEFFRDSRGLLIVDEAQHLSLAALETIRAIHDEAGVGIALVGNDEVYSRLKGGGQAALFAQLFSRVGKRVALRRVDDADAEKFAAAFGATEPEAVKQLQHIAKQPGALRGVVKTLRLAAMIAKGNGEALTVGHIAAAWTDLGGLS